jgi:hypothetical protein
MKRENTDFLQLQVHAREVHDVAPSLQHLIQTAVKGKSICAQKDQKPTIQKERINDSLSTLPNKLIAQDNMSHFCVAEGKKDEVMIQHTEPKTKEIWKGKKNRMRTEKPILDATPNYQQG